MKRRIFALLLAAALLLALLPAGVGAADADDTPSYAQADELFTYLYSALRGRKAIGTDASRADTVESIVSRADSVVPDSVRRMDDELTWETTDGIACHFSPYLYSLMTNTSSAPQQPERVLPAAKKSAPTARDVVLIAPYYGRDDSFAGLDGPYDRRAQAAAFFTGGDYYCYIGENATIDALAGALERAALVMIDSHGETAWGRTSYICLQTPTGITQADYAYDTSAGVNHVYYGGASANGVRYYEVDGTAISNHMKNDAPGNLVWNGTCNGMATQGICAPLLSRGVAAVYGYSQEVTFGADQCWMETAMNALTSAKDLSTAIAEAKKTWGTWDYSPALCRYHEWADYYVCTTADAARAKAAAFPVVASAQDAYPKNPNATQTVRSTWQLPHADVSLRFHLPDGVKCPDRKAYMYYTDRLPTPLGKPRNQENTYTFVGWSFLSFAPTARVPNRIFYAGEVFSFGYPRDASNSLSFGNHTADLYAVYSYPVGNRTYYTSQVPDGKYDPYDPSAHFADMPYGTWYYKNVRYGLANGLINGYTDGTFHPENTITRSEVVTILYRAAGSPKMEPTQLFPDVDPASWYGSAVTWAVQNHIVEGSNDGRFHPEMLASRAQLAVFFYRYAEAKSRTKDAIAAFPDAASVPGWAAKEMSWAVTQGIINGSKISGVAYLQPGANATRAEFMAILQRTITALGA